MSAARLKPEWCPECRCNLARPCVCARGCVLHPKAGKPQWRRADLSVIYCDADEPGSVLVRAGRELPPVHCARVIGHDGDHENGTHRWVQEQPEQEQETMSKVTLEQVDVVGRQEVAERCGVTVKAIDAWRKRDVGFPAPRWSTAAGPLWEWGADVQPWLQATDRGHYTEAEA